MFTTTLNKPDEASNPEIKVVVSNALPGIEYLLRFEMELKNKPAREIANNIRGVKRRTAFKIPNKEITEMIVTMKSPFPPNTNFAASAAGNRDFAIV